jgi:hypothetical protein
MLGPSLALATAATLASPASAAPFATASALTTPSADTTVVLGTRSIDMTGDGQPETLRLVGEGASLDSLELTFTIESNGAVLYAHRMAPLTRTVGYDGNRRTLTRAEQLERVNGYGAWFFDERKFTGPEELDEDWSEQRITRIPEAIARELVRQQVNDSLMAAGEEPDPRSSLAFHRRMAARPDTTGAGSIWQEIRDHGSIVFNHSPGGDVVRFVVWSPSEQTFVNLIDCC